ncbi:MAG: hypothetical protein ACRDGF_02410 [Chloroflexota bacterium]
MAPPFVGTVAQVILDAYPFWVLPGSYQVLRPRLRKAMPRADLGESYVDFGPGKRQWRFVVLALNDLSNYDGTPTGFTGQEYHDVLQSSYQKLNTLLTFVDPANSTWQVRFEHFAATVPDLRSQLTGVGYHVDVELVEG